MKKCYRCKEMKTDEEMSATAGFCKPCKKEYTKEYNLKNRDKILAYSKQYNEKNKDLIKQKSRKPQSAESRKAYKERNREYIAAKKKEYNSRPEIKEKRRLERKRYYEKLKLSKPPRVKRTIEEKKEIKRKYRQFRRATDVNFRIRQALSARVYDALSTTYTKSARTLELLGCDVNFLKAHLESKFLPTMTWDNYGKLWHIDHILPCASFDLSNPEQQNKCFHYSNLQPLFAVTTVIDGIEYIGNLNKQDKILKIAA